MIGNEIGLIWQIIIAALVGTGVLLRFCDVVKKVIELKHLHRRTKNSEKLEKTLVGIYCGAIENCSFSNDNDSLNETRNQMSLNRLNESRELINIGIELETNINYSTKQEARDLIKR